MQQPAREHAHFVRSAELPGVEALQATFISHRYSAHIHDTWTVAHVISGAARFQLEGQWQTAPAGTSFLIAPGVVHTGESATPAGYTYRVLYLEPERLGQGSARDLFHHPRRMPVLVRRHKLAQAAQRLLRTGTPPARAAAECGFYDQAHLNRHFKRVTGVTPASYMRPRSRATGPRRLPAR